MLARSPLMIYPVFELVDLHIHSSVISLNFTLMSPSEPSLLVSYPQYAPTSAFIQS